MLLVDQRTKRKLDQRENLGSPCARCAAGWRVAPALGERRPHRIERRHFWLGRHGARSPAACGLVSERQRRVIPAGVPKMAAVAPPDAGMLPTPAQPRHQPKTTGRGGAASHSQPAHRRALAKAGTKQVEGRTVGRCPWQSQQRPGYRPSL